MTRYIYAEDLAGNTNYDNVGAAGDTGAPGRIRFVWNRKRSNITHKRHQHQLHQTLFQKQVLLKKLLKMPIQHSVTRSEVLL